MKPLDPQAVAAMLAAQGVPLASGRAERIAANLNPLLAASLARCEALAFELEPGDFALALERLAAEEARSA